MKKKEEIRQDSQIDRKESVRYEVNKTLVKIRIGDYNVE